jgi:GDPmannose 4,6-dehydratase
VLGLQDKLYLGNLNAQRDWGHAKDYVEAMWMILQQEVPEDFVIATGITTPVRDFIKMSFAELGVELEFEGTDLKEIGKVKSINASIQEGHKIKTPLKVGDVVVQVDEKYFRPTEVELLIGDASKAMKKLGWKPKYDLPALVKDMVVSDLHLMLKDQYLSEGGFKTLNYYE